MANAFKTTRALGSEEVVHKFYIYDPTGTPILQPLTARNVANANWKNTGNRPRILWKSRWQSA